MFALTSRRVVLFDEGVQPAAVLVAGEKIAAVVDRSQVPADIPVEDFGDLVIAPGVIDAHVHINEPGRTEWEGFFTATRAAAAGGVTTLIDMPLNSSPVTTTAAALAEKRAAATGKCHVDVGIYGGVIPGHSQHVPELLAAGVFGLKAFLCDSGLPEFPAASLADMEAAALPLAAYQRPLLVHAELPLMATPPPRDVRDYAQYAASRPAQWEVDAIERLFRLCLTTRCRVHIVHLATGEALPMIAAARAAGLPLSVETCPHYLFFCQEDIPAGATQYKCAPPIRDRANREMLWQGLRDGLIDTIGSDHSPCPFEMKHADTGDFMAAWGGIASLQLLLPATWTAARQRGVSLEKLFAWLAKNPARKFGLDQRKGTLTAGLDADVVVFDPEAKWQVDAARLEHRHKVTPYHGAQVTGRAVRTYLRGAVVFDGEIAAPRGALLSCRRGKTITTSLVNSLSLADAQQQLTKCCAAPAWGAGMLDARPFTDDESLHATAEKLWWQLDRDQWLAAFAAHPKIGDVNSLRANFANTADWAGHEQASVQTASEVTLARLAATNEEYLAKFGYIFIVCASGKSADEMLAILESRLSNPPELEIRIAAAEQIKITHLRLDKLAP